MTVTAVRKDVGTLTLAITAKYDAPPARVWELWADPRQLERWWGPPTYPATVVDHDLTAGASVSYYMTGPEGDRHWGRWRITSSDAPWELAFEDGFADDTGAPDPALPVTTALVSLEQTDGGGTRMVIESTFASLEAMERLVSMGMEEGMRAALGQTDEIVAAS
ncbi:MAG: SRPBCC domain-containing protein [Chloroflexota bacterium]